MAVSYGIIQTIIIIRYLVLVHESFYYLKQSLQKHCNHIFIKFKNCLQKYLKRFHTVYLSQLGLIQLCNINECVLKCFKVFPFNRCINNELRKIIKRISLTYKRIARKSFILAYRIFDTFLEMSWTFEDISIKKILVPIFFKN